MEISSFLAIKSLCAMKAAKCTVMDMDCIHVIYQIPFIFKKRVTTRIAAFGFSFSNNALGFKVF